MTASLPMASAVQPTDFPLPLHAPAGLPAFTRLTRVSLAFIERRLNLYLRFGHSVQRLRRDRWRGCAFFLPGARLARVRCETTDGGAVRSQILVLQACGRTENMQRIPGVEPGAALLLQAEGQPQVCAVLSLVDAIETLNIDPADVSPAYWRTVHHRLDAGMPLPAYTAERHAAWLAGRVLP
ncbi:MAG: DUF2840 domain-containing protein [Rhodanobacter sp.]|jgi:hypothetical protein